MKRRIVVGIGNAGPLHCNKCPMGEGMACRAFEKIRRADKERHGHPPNRFRLADCIEAQCQVASIEEEREA